jgi:hypothetical protein
MGGPAAFQYPDNMAQNTGYYPPPVSGYNAQYGQPISPYQNQQYGNQYPQSQYTQNSAYPQTYSNNPQFDPLMQMYPAQPRHGSLQ